MCGMVGKGCRVGVWSLTAHPTSIVRWLASPVSVGVNLRVNLTNENNEKQQDPVGKVNLIVAESAVKANAVAAVDHSREGSELDLAIGAHAGGIRDAEATERGAIGLLLNLTVTEDGACRLHEEVRK